MRNLVEQTAGQFAQQSQAKFIGIFPKRRELAYDGLKIVDLLVVVIEETGH